MNVQSILLILFIIFILVKLNNGISSDKNNTENYESSNKLVRNITRGKKNREHFITSSSDKRVVDDLIDDIVSWDDSLDNNVLRKEYLNPNFLNIQFHNDYRDVMTAINNLIPDKKQFFNLPNRPLKYSQPETGEVKNLIIDFINVVNRNLLEEVPSQRNSNSGWDEAIVDPTVQSGWDKVQNLLGLPTSLYDEPAKKSPIKLIATTKVQKYETDDEIKYECDIIVQKNNVDDQMILRASFVQDKTPLKDENNFFNTTTIDLKIVIEYIYIIGYLSKEGNNDKLNFDKDFDKFYDYSQMEYNNLMDPKYVQKILMEKYKQRTEEMEQRNALLDEEGQEFHKQLPSIYDFSNIKGTQTIFDDMNYHRTFI